MNEEESKVIDELRAKGFCIVIFTPVELGDAVPNKIEDRLVTKGWELIDDWNNYEEN